MSCANESLITQSISLYTCLQNIIRSVSVELWQRHRYSGTWAPFPRMFLCLFHLTHVKYTESGLPWVFLHQGTVFFLFHHTRI